MTRNPIVIAIAVAVGLTGAFASSAEAWLTRDGHWAFNGHDYNDSTTFEAYKNDPMTLLFKGGMWTDGSRRERISRIESILEQDWDNGSMGRRLCNGGKWLVYRIDDQFSKTDKTDLNMSTSATCDNQWHTRIWNDREINNDYQWAVGGIHRETRPLCCSTHKLRFSFETAEAKAIQALDSHCSLRDWRALPGSGPGKFHGFYSNGRISRISMQRVDFSRPTGEKCIGAFR